MSEHMQAGAAAVAVLRQAGINRVFGLLGGSMLELYDAIAAAPDITYIGARHECAAGHMADAWARVSGKPGIVLGAQSGPGVSNLVTAVAEAYLAYSPMVVIAGAITRAHLGRDTFQEINQQALFAPIAKRSIMVPTPERLPEMLGEALRVANAGRRGPVVLHVPRDVFVAEIAVGPIANLGANVTAGGPSGGQIDAILAMLREARRPVIVAGGGIKWSRGSAELAVLAEALEIPVVAATGHADVLATDHPLHAGQAGPRGNAVASALTRDADLLIALGTRLGFNSTFHSHDYVTDSGRIVQIDIEAAAIGRYFPVALGIVADARQTASALAEAVGRAGLDGTAWSSWSDGFRAAHARHRRERDAEGRINTTPLSPLRVLAEIRENLPDNAIITLDTGAMCLQAADRLRHGCAPSLITPLDFGLVGFGYAAALGAQAAAADRPVVAVMGDGGFGMTMIELASAVQHDLPVIAVVLDNGAWGAEKAYQRDFFGGRFLGADLVNPPFGEVAALFGATGYAVDAPGDTGQALAQALAERRPAVIHVKVDCDAIQSLRKDLFKPVA
jgi:thiamine pyrophosphate-dependent acetolactate synthase large subunit-like protein